MFLNSCFVAFVTWSAWSSEVGGSGFFLVNRYQSAPAHAEQLRQQGEQMRQINAEWRRFWMNDMPTHLMWDRLDGRIVNEPAVTPQTKKIAPKKQAKKKKRKR